MKIKLTQPGGPYHADIDTGVMGVEIREAFIGPMLITDEGEQLRVIMRDGGFEVEYFGPKAVTLTEFKQGKINRIT